MLGDGGSSDDSRHSRPQRLLEEYAKLDAVVIACSTQSPAEQRNGIVRRARELASVGVTYPLMSDPKELVTAPFGAKSPLGGTSRQTFIIDPSGVCALLPTEARGLLAA